MGTGKHGHGGQPAARCSFRPSLAAPAPPRSSKVTDPGSPDSHCCPHQLMGGQGDLVCGLAAPPSLPVRWGLCMGTQISLTAGSLIRNRLCGDYISTIWGCSVRDLWWLGSKA